MAEAKDYSSWNLFLKLFIEDFLKKKFFEDLFKWKTKIYYAIVIKTHRSRPNYKYFYFKKY